MKRKLLITLVILIALASIGLFIYAGIQSWQIYAAEFNAQMEQLGFYKEDVKVLWQLPKIILNVILYIVASILLIVDFILFLWKVCD